MKTALKTEFFGRSRAFEIIATFFPPEGKCIIDLGKITKKFIFWNEVEYKKELMELQENLDVESIYTIETETATNFQKRIKIEIPTNKNMKSDIQELEDAIRRVIKIFEGRVGLTLPEQFALDGLIEVLK